MATVKKNERFVPIKNYIIVFLIVIGAIALALYAFSWHKVIKENRLSTSYLIESKTVSNEIQGLEGLNDVLSEVSPTYYLYISYTGSEEIYKMEKELASLINKYKLEDEVYFLNVTSIKDDNDLVKQVNEALNLDDQVKHIPTIIYYSDGKVVDIISKDGNNIMDIGDFQKLLDKNKIEKDR
jgi:hypothetical protein